MLPVSARADSLTITFGLSLFLGSALIAIWAFGTLQGPYLQTDAVITDLTSASGAQGQSAIIVTCSYIVSGRTFKATGSQPLSVAPALRVGDRIPVFYSRNNPGVSGINRPPDRSIWLVVSGTLAVAGLAIAIKSRKICRTGPCS